MRPRGFTLVEILVVIGIIAIVSAIVFPAVIRAKRSASQAHCISNLGQAGKSMMMYMSDFDDQFPNGVDCVDKYRPDIWASYPQWQALITVLPLMHQLLQPYVKSFEIFRCPNDIGTKVVDNHYDLEFLSSPSLYATYGSSYFYRTELTFRRIPHTALQNPAAINMLFDAAGHWHSGERELRLGMSMEDYRTTVNKFRYNILFADMHVKSSTFGDLQRAWSIDVQ